MRTWIFLLFLITAALSSYAQKDSLRQLVRKGYSLSFPDTWKVDSSGITGADVFLLAPHKDSNLKFRESVNVMLQDLGSFDMNMDTYKTFSEAQVKNMKDAELHSSEIVTNKGDSLYRLHFSFTMGDLRLKAKAYCILRNSIAYLITYTAEAAHYDIYAKEAEAMLTSFQLH